MVRLILSVFMGILLHYEIRLYFFNFSLMVYWLLAIEISFMSHLELKHLDFNESEN